MELNVALLCEFRKDDVVPFIKKKYYPIKSSLETCKKFHVNQAVAYLLRRTGSYAESLDTYIILLSEVSGKLLDPAIKKDYIDVYIREYKEHFEYAIKVCAKYSRVLGKTEDPGLWFLLLSHVHGVWMKIAEIKKDPNLANISNSPTKSNRLLEQIASNIGECIKKLLSVLMGHVDIEKVLEQIASKYGELEVENFKEMFSAMITSYVLQEKILDSAKQILGQQLTDGFAGLVKARHKAVSVKAIVCQKCKKHIQPIGGSEFFAYSCGHIYHERCSKNMKCCEECLNSGLRVGQTIIKPNNKNNGNEAEQEKKEEEQKESEEKKKQEIMKMRRMSRSGGTEKKMEYYWKRMRIFEKTKIKSFSVF